jgi:hypothetical protein
MNSFLFIPKREKGFQMALIDPKTPFSTIDGNGVLFFVPP